MVNRGSLTFTPKDLVFGPCSPGISQLKFKGILMQQVATVGNVPTSHLLDSFLSSCYFGPELVCAEFSMFFPCLRGFHMGSPGSQPPNK